MQWPQFDLFDHLIDQDRRVSRLEERQKWALKDLDGHASRMSRLERKVDKVTTGLGLGLLCLLVFVNLPPEISVPIIQAAVKLIPAYP